MKVLSVILLTVLAAVALAETEERRYYDLNEAGPLFEKFMKDFNRVYKDEADKTAHFEAFKKSLNTINESNQKNPSATYGINKFADYTEEERRSLHGFRRN